MKIYVLFFIFRKAEKFASWKIKNVIFHFNFYLKEKKQKFKFCPHIFIQLKTSLMIGCIVHFLSRI